MEHGLDAPDMMAALGTLLERKQACLWMTKVSFKIGESFNLKPVE